MIRLVLAIRLLLMSRLAAATLLLLIASAPANGQVAIEVRAGASVGNHVPAYAGFDLLPGLSLSGTAEVRPVSFASLYGTYSRSEFGCEEGFCTGGDVQMLTEGFGGGVRLHPRYLPWVRAGVVQYGTTVQTEAGESVAQPSMGYEAGTGFTIPFGRHVRLLPGVFLRTQPGETRTTMAVADVGLNLSF